MNERARARPLLVEESEAAAILGLSRYRLRMERRQGKIAAKLIGNRYFYNVQVLEQYASSAGEASEHPHDQQAGRILSLRSTP
jgi:hypothetical protein